MVIAQMLTKMNAKNEGISAHPPVTADTIPMPVIRPNMAMIKPRTAIHTGITPDNRPAILKLRIAVAHGTIAEVKSTMLILQRPVRTVVEFRGSRCAKLL